MAPPPTTLRAGRALGPDGLVGPCEVVVADGRIAALRPVDRVPEDLAAVVLAPGFVDLQCNGVGDVDVALADGDDWDRLDQLLLAQGVTTWVPTLVSAPEPATLEACARVAEAARRSAGPRPTIAGVHLEGPFLTVPGAHRPEHLRPAVPDGWAAGLPDIVRIVTLAPEVGGGLRAVTALAAGGRLVALGHSACDAELAHAAAAAGARLVTHLGNAMAPFHHRAPGLFGAALTDRRLAVSVIADLEHVHADTVALAFAAKADGAVALVTDAVAASAGTVGPVTLAPAAVPGGAARLADGTLAGSALTMPTAIAHVAGAGRQPLERALRAAATTPARLLELRDRGALAAGGRADVVALHVSDAPAVTVVATWVDGVLAHGAWPAL